MDWERSKDNNRLGGEWRRCLPISRGSCESAADCVRVEKSQVMVVSPVPVSVYVRVHEKEEVRLGVGWERSNVESTLSLIHI